MKFGIYNDLSNLTEQEKNKLDCHRSSKTRYAYTDHLKTTSELIFPFDWRVDSSKEVLPLREAYQYKRYFSQDSSSDQLWGRPTLYHLIGSVDFHKATIYSDKRTKELLEDLHIWPKPIIHYRYKLHGQELEADSHYLISKVAYNQRREKRELRELPLKEPIGETLEPVGEGLESKERPIVEEHKETSSTDTSTNTRSYSYTNNYELFASSTDYSSLSENFPTDYKYSSTDYCSSSSEYYHSDLSITSEDSDCKERGYPNKRIKIEEDEEVAYI